ncbi:MAG TPA: zf-HC2 domain-containing protein [Anaerolineales bacterium]|nr:zf-HC2 domain-containing protein [Anaerolineales bacterium]
MNHRPFEDWLLEDQQLTSDQQRELRAHLRTCPSCAAIAESNLALHSTRLIAPPEGFVSRFELHLAGHRRAARIRQIIGSVIFVLAGLAFLYWLASPFIEEVMRSPAAWITTVVGYFLFVLTSMQALSEVGRVFLRLLPDFVSPLGWLVILFLLSGLGSLELLSIWRFARTPQGV